MLVENCESEKAKTQNLIFEQKDGGDMHKNWKMEIQVGRLILKMDTLIDRVDSAQRNTV